MGHGQPIDGGDETCLKRYTNVMAVAATMMVRVGLVSIGRHLVPVTSAMLKRAGGGEINASHTFGRVRDRSQPERQHEHQTKEQGSKPMHWPSP
jgi:hypothetical protein